MKGPDEIQRGLVRQWVEKADQDLAAAEILLKSDCRLPAVIAFHSQQAVEKYLKALLVRYQIHFPKTHDIGVLLSLISTIEPGVASSLDGTVALNPFGVEVRYPGDGLELLPGEEEEIVEMARRTRDEVRSLLSSYLS
jgi:HEPN domain-containing protein